MTFIDNLRAKRRKLADLLSDPEYSGIREIVEDLYPDRAHFIYELLQNAEDAGATEVVFDLNDTKLCFEHNGRPFTNQDVEGITNIGKGSKRDQDDKIGRFGIGFKAVFVYSETPSIWSPEHSFIISQLVLPTELDRRPELGRLTRFEFPFNSSKKPPRLAYDEIKIGLNSLAETTLLFLSSIETIQWRVAGGPSGRVLRIGHTDHYIEILREVDEQKTASFRFLRFSAPVEDLPKQNVSVAFPLQVLPDVEKFDAGIEISKQLKIVAADPGQVSVYFPADKETSGLRFHLHAPFVPELSRASIKEVDANHTLFEQLGRLAADSLHRIRELKLLRPEFLAVLPNSEDSLPERYEVIREAIVAEMNDKPLTPTQSRSHAPARSLYQAKASLKELLMSADLKFLTKAEGSPQWAIGATQRNSAQDCFLSDLAITTWDTSHFVKMVIVKATEGRVRLDEPPWVANGPDNDFMAWLAKKPLEWHQDFYLLLRDEATSQSDFQRLTNTRIVRLSDGDYAKGSKCYFPAKDAPRDDVHPRVDPRILSAGKSKPRQENTQRFLESLGVREVGEAEEILAVLRTRYGDESDGESRDNVYKKDLKRFADFVRREPDQAEMFSKFKIFRVLIDSEECWVRSEQVYLDAPYADTGLTALYIALGESATRYPLSNFYKQSNISDIATFAKAVGALSSIPIVETSIWNNPQRSQLFGVGGERSTSPIDEDYTIERLAELLETPTVELSRLIWKSMNELSPRFLRARYQRSVRGGCREADSQLVHILRSTAWVPQKTGGFTRPAEAFQSLLPKGFSYDELEWIKAVKFGESERLSSEANKRLQETAKALGFADASILERAQEFATIPPEEQKRLLDHYRSHQKTELPNKTPSNPDRRAERVAQRANEAPERVIEIRERSVSVNQGAVKKETEPYLRRLYTNRDGVTICQICQGPLPFKLPEGDFYMVKTPFLDDLQPERLHYQNYLTLCPNHDAMFVHANEDRDGLKEAFERIEGNELKIVLAGETRTIFFNDTHIADLKAIMNGGPATPNDRGGDGNT